MRYGKSYYAIVQTIAQAKVESPDCRIWAPSESMKKRVEEIGKMIGQTVTVMVTPKIEKR